MTLNINSIFKSLINFEIVFRWLQLILSLDFVVSTKVENSLIPNTIEEYIYWSEEHSCVQTIVRQIVVLLAENRSDFKMYCIIA